ncbi:MAG: hypothetical protein QG646_641 [Euryarchaeota archaeon]|nr:hypothetical protein [Euryarchaeota archaeon]
MTREKMKIFEFNFEDHLTICLDSNHLTELPSEIIEFENLTSLDLDRNELTEFPYEILKLKNLTSLDLSRNKLTQLPPEIGDLKNVKILNLSRNQLTQLPPEIGNLKNLETLILFNNSLTHLPTEIGNLKNLKNLYLQENDLTQLPVEIGKLENLTSLRLYKNELTELPAEVGKLNKLTSLDVSYNKLTHLPAEIGKLENLTALHLCDNELTEIPSEIGKLNKLTTFSLYENPLIIPPPEIVSRGLEAIFTFLNQSKTTENNEAKLILVGEGEAGKTCLAYRLINDEFLEDTKITEGINISKWIIPCQDSENSEIKLNIWDFGGQEIYHATHQFFLTERSVYLLVWNARRTKDSDNIYKWLHTIETFGGDSPIILVMSKMNESDDDLNYKDLKSKFTKIADHLKIDSEDGKGISELKEKIRKISWDIPLMRTPWVDSWYKVREKLEGFRENWIKYEDFYNLCVSEGLDDKNIRTLDGYLHDLGVTLHFKDSDNLALKNIVILKPEWATGAFYKILSTKSVLRREGRLLHCELEQIWDKEAYPSEIHPQLMELMNKFELAYELPNRSGYLVAELLPVSAPKFIWNERNNLCIYYSYDYFLPAGIITRFIVRMHQNIEYKENGLPLCWREGVVLNLQNSRALVRMKPDEREIEVKVKGENKRGALGAICNEIDVINASMKKIKVSKQIPCNCSENCPKKYSYDELLKAEINDLGTIPCLWSCKQVSVSSLLDGYNKVQDRVKEYNESSRNPGLSVILSPTFSPTVIATADTKQTMEVEQITDVKTDVKVEVDISLEINLPRIQTEFDNLRREIKNLDPELKSEMDEIQDSLDEVSADDQKEKLKKPFNKLRRLLIKLGDPDSDYNKIIAGTQKATELTQKTVETFNKVAPLLGILSLHGIQ